jgi:hypothetical protein
MNASLKKISHGSEIDMRMRSHAHCGTWLEFQRSHVIEENKRSDHSVRGEWKNAANNKAVAQITLSTFN